MNPSQTPKPQKPKNKRPNLRPPAIYIRIRPNDESGNGGHSVKEERVEKELHSFTEDSISISDNHDVKEYSFPSLVFAPDSTQKKVYDEIILNSTASATSAAAPPQPAAPKSSSNVTNGSSVNDAGLIHSFVKGYHNVLFYAYGQTGTGKTYTIFGSEESLQHTTFHNDWGIFPRLCCELFEKIGEEHKSSPTRFILQASAIEFYLAQSYDLLHDTGKVPCVLDPITYEPIGNTQMEINSMDNVFQLIERIHKNRTTAGTKMNDSSSRGHCALILTLYQVNNQFDEKELTITKWHIVDLAGAERPDKSGVDRLSGTEAMMDIYFAYRNGTEVNPGAQSLLINFELSGLMSEIHRAKENYIRGKNHSPPRQLISPSLQYISSCFNGKTLLTMVICLSQAPQHGWETWFSLEKFGAGMSKLKTPLSRVKKMSFGSLLQRTMKEEKQCLLDLHNTPEFGSPKSKYYSYRKAKVHQKQNLLLILNQISS
mmetsp:Transcript_8201/g.12344  ORF Transcript_8201/g.12344 Transcript_8201/m.12344 type:complete len:485 (-) Transcript_8201:2001-3455(-)